MPRGGMIWMVRSTRWVCVPVFVLLLGCGGNDKTGPGAGGSGGVGGTTGSGGVGDGGRGGTTGGGGDGGVGSGGGGATGGAAAGTAGSGGTGGSAGNAAAGAGGSAPDGGICPWTPTPCAQCDTGLSCCGGACCGPGEWCDTSGSAPTCRCGSGAACPGGISGTCTGHALNPTSCDRFCCLANCF